MLLRAFMATLEELEDAHLLLHLVDISAADFEDRIESVEGVINSLGLAHKKRLIVFNKIDKIDRTFIPNIEKRYDAVSISAFKKEGIDRLVPAIEEALPDDGLQAIDYGHSKTTDNGPID